MSKRKLPVRTKTIELADEWVGWEFTTRVNPKLKTLNKLSSGEFDSIVEGLSEIVTGWNFVDEDGESLGNPSITSIAEIPSDLATKMVQAINEAITTIEGN